ncbi:MAG: GNAT family N-acetyltransferase [Thaumarchaeota archaeon]|nr:GNAT family N-acetyltransferase [Nitrososphaerota archaeon]
MDATVRPARPSDKEPLMSFIRNVWGGHDYIPFVWEDWLKSDRGRMFVVEVGGVPVGMNRVQFLEDGSAWFEGVRVHPDFRGKGLASMLGENSMRVAKERGIRVYRLTSGSKNRLAHRQITRIEFNEVARFSVYEPENRDLKPRGKARRVTIEEVEEARRIIEGSKEFRLGTGVFWHNFAAASLSKGVIEKLVEEGSVWRLGEALAVVRMGKEGAPAWEEVCFVGGRAADAMKLVKSLVGRSRRAKERWVFVPQRSPLIHHLRRSGFKRNYAMILFERRAVNG